MTEEIDGSRFKTNRNFMNGIVIGLEYINKQIPATLSNQKFSEEYSKPECLIQEKWPTVS